MRKTTAMSSTNEKLLNDCSANARRSSFDVSVIASRLSESATKRRPIRLAEAVPIVR